MSSAATSAVPTTRAHRRRLRDVDDALQGVATSSSVRPPAERLTGPPEDLVHAIDGTRPLTAADRRVSR
ncbi:hypothetical protein [Pseudonocardia halophobica]|uniref:hypothetical protein n=1 Tax=Pseudonocardia halophobica TaxID=29401 RepID=UPI000B27F6F3|nr:hypothetical protein [Pseudonocardia halophobica]